MNRGAWLDSRSGLTSYEGIAAQLRAAGSDPEVRSVLLDISSPGGEAAGMAGLADLIRSVRQTKPVTAFVNDMAASAAYGIASAASEIVISPTSIVGSIGVVMLHADRSGELATQGVKPTLIFAGSHKVSDSTVVATLTTANGGLARISDIVVEITIPPASTAGLSPGSVVMDMVRTDLEPDRHLNFTLEIPVVRPVTRGL